MSAQNSFLVFSGTSTRYLAEKICASLGCPLGNLVVTKFSDGEFAVSYEESIRGRDVFLVQSTFPSSDNLMELLLMIDAAKRASARSICAVVPYFGWARQDRKSKPRVSIGAKLVADLLSVAGIDRLMTMDLHADQEQGFFNVPVRGDWERGIIVVQCGRQALFKACMKGCAKDKRVICFSRVQGFQPVHILHLVFPWTRFKALNAGM